MDRMAATFYATLLSLVAVIVSAHSLGLFDSENAPKIGYFILLGLYAMCSWALATVVSDKLVLKLYGYNISEPCCTRWPTEVSDYEAPIGLRLLLLAVSQSITVYFLLFKLG